jgi:hypothetical protein
MQEFIMYKPIKIYIMHNFYYQIVAHEIYDTHKIIILGFINSYYYQNKQNITPTLTCFLRTNIVSQEPPTIITIDQ